MKVRYEFAYGVVWRYVHVSVEGSYRLKLTGWVDIRSFEFSGDINQGLSEVVLYHRVPAPGGPDLAATDMPFTVVPRSRILSVHFLGEGDFMKKTEQQIKLEHEMDRNPFVTTETAVEEAMMNDDGFCISCRDWTSDGHVEPDAEAYKCGVCGVPAVYGTEWCLIAGWFNYEGGDE